MAKELYHGSLTKHDEWSSVSRTINDETKTLPAGGDAIQNYIKEQFESKVGYFYNYVSGSISKYWCFADEEACELYLKWFNDKTNEEFLDYENLLIGSFDAPAPYTASINVLYNIADGGETVSTILSSSTNNYIYFKFAIKDTGGTETRENVNATITFTNNGATRTWKGILTGGKIASLLVDDYISTGTNIVNITIQGTSALVSTKTSLNINVVELSLSSTFNFGYYIDANTEELGIPFSITGSGQKFVEWFIDGVCVDNGKSQPMYGAYSGTKQLPIYMYDSGKHSLQIRSYEIINNENFYGDTLYYDFVIEGNSNTEILLSAKMPNGKLVGAGNNMLDKLVINGHQFEKNIIYISTYSPSNSALSIDIIINDDLITSLSSTNNSFVTWEYTPVIYGTLNVELVTVSHNIYYRNYLTYDIKESELNVAEYVGGIVAKFSAKGRSNNETNKDVWKYTTAGGKTYSASFNNVKWNDASGWHNDTLVLSNGATVTFDFNPFNMVTSNGFTFEIELETSDLKSDDVSIMQIGNNNSSNIKISGTSASITSKLGTTITTNYKDNERMKLAFVINSKTSVTAKKLMFIINNSVIERSATYSDVDAFEALSEEKTFTIGNTNGDVTVKIHNIRIYQTALTPQQEFNNYALDSNNIANIINRNDVFESDETTVSVSKLQNVIPVMIFTGDMNKLRSYNDKKSPIIFDIEYTNPFNPEYNFIMKNAYVTKQGTSSIKYPCPNLRIYTRKASDPSTTLQLPNLNGFENEIFSEGTMYYLDANNVKRHPQTNQPCDGKLLYSFKDNALPAEVWTIKSDFAESSMTHNTGIARWFNNINKLVTISGTTNEVTKSDKLCKTDAQAKVEEINVKYHDAIIDKDMETYPFDIRTTVDGFPICVFYRLSDTSANPDETKLIFMGQFNFNNDKSSTNIYGFNKIEAYVPDNVDINGNALSLKKTTVFKNDNVMCWEGSSNEDPIGQFKSIKFDIGAPENYDFTGVEDRAIFAGFETRYPDSKKIELFDGEVPGDLFNNTSTLETLVRWIYFTKPAIDLRIYKTDKVNYIDGYELKAFTEATPEQIEAAKQSNEQILYIKTNDSCEGTADTYEACSYNSGALYKSLIVKYNITTAKKYFINETGKIVEHENIDINSYNINDIIYLDNDNNITDFEHKINTTIYYIKRTDIDYENVKKVITTTNINDIIYTGYVMNWQGNAILSLVGRIIKGGEKIEKDINSIYYNVINNGTTSKKVLMTLDNGTQCSSHNVEVILTKKSNGTYTYIDGYGKEQNYIIKQGTVEGQAGYVKQYNYINKTYMYFFTSEYLNHFDVYKLASYYIYTKRFGTVDQMVKNTMLTTEDGKHWYFIPYDNDTINGVRNDSLIKYKWDVTRETYDSSINGYAYAGFQSVLWNNLESCEGFMNIVRKLDAAMSKIATNKSTGEINALTYDGACYWFDTMQSDKWCERIYNASEEFKYISPYINNEDNSPYLAFLQGTRKSHRHWWLRHRFDLVDAQWISGEYKNFYIGLYSGAQEGGELCKITAASDFYFGWLVNNESVRESGVFVKANETYTFTTKSALGIGTPVELLAPYQIKELDCSEGVIMGNMFNIDGDGTTGAYINTRGTQLKKLIIGNYTFGENIRSVEVARISGINSAAQLQWLNIQNCCNLAEQISINNLYNLHIYEAEGSNTTVFNPANGSILYKVELPSINITKNGSQYVRNEGSGIIDITLKNIVFDYSLKFEYNKNGIKDGYFKYIPNETLKTINIENVTGDFDSYEFVKTWYNAIKNVEAKSQYKLTLKGINWNNSVPADFIIKLKQLNLGVFDIQGYIKLQSMTYAQYKKIIELYGSSVFNTSGALIFDAPATQFLFTDINDEQKNIIIKSGTDIEIRTEIFPLTDTSNISFVLYAANGDRINTMNENNNYVFENFELTPKLVDINGKIYGKLHINESTTSKVCAIAANVDGNITPLINRINITATGVTMPNSISLTGNNIPLIFEEMDIVEYDININNNNISTDAQIKKFDFSILYNDSLLSSGTNELITEYLSIKWDKVNNKIIIWRDNVPVNDVNFSVNIKAIFDTTNIDNYRSLDINVTSISTFPSKYIILFDSEHNTGVDYVELTSSELLSSKPINKDICIIKESNIILGFEVYKAGTYHFDFKYQTNKGKYTTSGVHTPNILSPDLNSYGVTFENITINGFDVVVNDTPTDDPNRTLNNVYSNAIVNICDKNAGNGILVKKGNEEYLIYNITTDTPIEKNYTLNGNVFVTRPTNIYINESKNISINNNTPKTVNFTYDIKTIYYKGIEPINSPIITCEYTVETKLITEEPESVIKIVDNGNIGFNIIFGNDCSNVKDSYELKTIVTHTSINNDSYKTFDITTTINITKTIADATEKQDMILDKVTPKFYLLDKNMLMYLLDDETNRSTTYDNLDVKPEIIGIGCRYYIPINNEDYSRDAVFGIGFKDVNTFSPICDKQITPPTNNSFSNSALNKYFDFFNGYEMTMLFNSNNLSHNSAIYKAYHMYDEYENVKGYIGGYSEYLYIMDFKDRINTIAEMYNTNGYDEIDATNQESNYVTITQASTYVLRGISPYKENYNDQNYTISIWTTSNSNPNLHVRPLIKIN